MSYHSMCMMITNECNIRCLMCGNPSINGAPTTVNKDVATKYIQSTKESSINNVGFSGGEPFLHYSLLKELVSVASSIGKSTSVMTNGYWAENYSETVEILFTLKNAGLNVCGVSFDEFHADFIHKKNILNIIRAVKKVNMNIVIQSVILQDSKPGDVINKLGEDIEGVNLLFIACCNTKNVIKRIDQKKFIRKTSPRGLFCGKSGSFSVEHNGTVRPCCNAFIFDTELVVGDINNNDVKKTIKAMKSNPFLYMLRNFGFDYFLGVVKKQSLNICVPENLTSSCELCSVLFSTENYYTLLPYVYEDVKQLCISKNL